MATKTNFLIGAVTGAVLSGIVFYSGAWLLQPERISNTDSTMLVANKLSPQSCIDTFPELSCPGTIVEDAASNFDGVTTSDDSEINAQSRRTGVPKSSDCDPSCATRLIGKFIDGGDMADAEWDAIREGSGSLIQALSQSPDALVALTDKITFASDESEIDSLLSLASQLPDHQSLDVMRGVANYSAQHKAKVVQALSGLSVHSAAAVAEIENMIVGESDPLVIAAALNAVETVDNHQFGDTTWQTLTLQLSFVNDEQLKAAIVQSLAKHGKGEVPVLLSEINHGLAADSEHLQLASIESLRYMLATDRAQADLMGPELESTLNQMAGNSQLDISVRMEALALLQETFYRRAQ